MARAIMRRVRITQAAPSSTRRPLISIAISKEPTTEVIEHQGPVSATGPFQLGVTLRAVP
jgi:hypothetical protein